MNPRLGIDPMLLKTLPEGHSSKKTAVICGGMKAQRDEALAFYGAAPRFFMTGDCEKVANLQAGNRSAMGKVTQL